MGYQLWHLKSGPLQGSLFVLRKRQKRWDYSPTTVNFWNAVGAILWRTWLSMDGSSRIIEKARIIATVAFDSRG
jgi:hypothetical protein